MTVSRGVIQEQGALVGAVQSIRRRWRFKHALRGSAVAVIAGFVTLVVASYILRWAHYADGSVIALRVLLAAAVVALIVRLIVRPLRATADDNQVALYAEERAQVLDATLITAVDVSRTANAARSPALAARVMHAAVVGLQRADAAVDHHTLQWSAAVLGAVLAFATAATWFGPQAVRDGARLLLVPAGGNGSYAVGVQPGNAIVARGGDQLITAALRGFESERVELLVRSGDSPAWTRLAMTIDSSGRYAFRLFDIALRQEYAVEASGIRSPVYALDVADLPYVKRIDLEYRFPAYTQLPPQHVDSSGDIAALRGTLVRVAVTPTIPTISGRLVVDGGDTLALVPTSNGTLIALLRVDKPGFYKVELRGRDGRLQVGSLDYTIDVLPDRKPTVSFLKPGRDAKALAVDEVFTEARAQDDYGVSKLQLVYSVNGGAEKTIPLSSATTRVLRDIAAGHTFMLEDMTLVPGDVVSYYARAVDNNTVSGAQEATSDIYFLQIRPYANDYRQQQSGPQQGGGQPQENPGQLSQQQRDIIAGTFNISRDSATVARKALAEHLATVRLSQQRLREQVNELAKRLVDRGIAGDSGGWKKIAEILPKAAAEMDSAERKLASGSPKGALPAEQRALQQLQRAEAVFREIQIQMAGQGAAGDGKGGGANAQDLADIFEMQRDKLRNQYETVNRGQDSASATRQQQEAQVDAVREKLRQLAARQQQEDERMRRKADSLSRMGQSGASGGGNQRQMADDAAEAARQLERLARERQSPQIADAARKLQEASDAMRRAAAAGQRGAGESRTAQQRLDEAKRLLDQEKANGAQRDVADAQQSARALAAQEAQVESDVQRLRTADASAKQQLVSSIQSRKGAMLDSLRSLTSRLDKAATQNGRSAPKASRALGEAADTLRSRRMEDRVRITQQGLRTAPPDALESLEHTIGEGLGDLEQRLQKAAAAAAGEATQGQGEQKALDKMRDLVRGVESMDERARQRAQQRASQQAGGQRPGGGTGSAGGAGGRGQGGARGAAAGNDGGQFTREMGARLNDARTLRDQLAQQGVDVAPLDRAIQGMRAAERAGGFDNPQGTSALSAPVVEELKAYEFALRRALGEADGGKVMLGRSGEVPAAFRGYVEEYYRSIAKPAKP